MALIIPITRTVDDASHFDQDVTVDGSNYTLRFDWNERLGAWFLTVLGADGETVCTPEQRLVCNWKIAKYLSNRDPEGFFVLADTANDFSRGVDPSFDDLGARHQLLYFSPGEL